MSKASKKKPVAKQPAQPTARGPKWSKTRPAAFSPGILDISSPFPGEKYLLPANALCVTGSVNEDTVAVLLTLILADPAIDPEPTPAADPGKFVRFDIIPGSGGGFANVIGYQGNSIAPPLSGGYKLIAYPVDADGALGSEKKVAFVRAPASEPAVVSAQCCPWFALASSSTAASPYGEAVEPLETHRPLAVSVPTNAGMVRFFADAGGRWRHFATDPGTESDADGRDDLSTGPETGDNGENYQMVENASLITAFTGPVNKLVGVWKTSDTGYEQFAIGLSNAPIAVPNDAKQDGRLFLAMHDGKRWFNNSGAIDVTIIWQAEACSLSAARRAKGKSATKPAQGRATRGKAAPPKSAKR